MKTKTQEKQKNHKSNTKLGGRNKNHKNNVTLVSDFLDDNINDDLQCLLKSFTSLM